MHALCHESTACQLPGSVLQHTARRDNSSVDELRATVDTPAEPSRFRAVTGASQSLRTERDTGAIPKTPAKPQIALVSTTAMPDARTGFRGSARALRGRCARSYAPADVVPRSYARSVGRSRRFAGLCSAGTESAGRDGMKTSDTAVATKQCQANTRYCDDKAIRVYNFSGCDYRICSGCVSSRVFIKARVHGDFAPFAKRGSR